MPSPSRVPDVQCCQCRAHDVVGACVRRVRSLSSDRAVFMRIEGINAVSVVNEFLGPANPGEWDDYPDGFRPDTAEGREYNTIHSAAVQAHADAVLEIMDDIHTRA